MPDFAGGCTLIVVTEPLLNDASVPGSGGVFYYLHRALTPNAGSWGRGAERVIACGP